MVTVKTREHWQYEIYMPVCYYNIATAILSHSGSHVMIIPFTYLCLNKRVSIFMKLVVNLFSR